MSAGAFGDVVQRLAVFLMSAEMPSELPADRAFHAQ